MEIGDIVSAEGDRWVVVAFQGSPRSGRIATLRNVNKHGTRTQFTAEEAGLTVVESPTIEAGERVKVNGQPGTVLSREGPLGPVFVQLDDASKPLTSAPQYSVEIHNEVARVPIELFVYENRT